MQALWSEIGLNITIKELEAADWVPISTSPSGDRGPTLFQQQHDNNTGDAGFTVPVMYQRGPVLTVADPISMPSSSGHDGDGRGARHAVCRGLPHRP